MSQPTSMTSSSDLQGFANAALGLSTSGTLTDPSSGSTGQSGRPPRPGPNESRSRAGSFCSVASVADQGEPSSPGWGPTGRRPTTPRPRHNYPPGATIQMMDLTGSNDSVIAAGGPSSSEASGIAGDMAVQGVRANAPQYDSAASGSAIVAPAASIEREASMVPWRPSSEAIAVGPQFFGPSGGAQSSGQVEAAYPGSAASGSAAGGPGALMVLPRSAASGSATWGADLVAQSCSAASGSAAGGAFLSAASPTTYGPGGVDPSIPRWRQCWFWVRCSPNARPLQNGHGRGHRQFHHLQPAERPRAG